ncbi:MAG: hypothetical protein HY800_09630 [Ignavibacteriales bacterium]|nr:hypothetical protein [Ignavibacteriales bacterium]
MNYNKFAQRFFHKRFRNQPTGYPIATIAYYGPDDQTATKVAVGIVDSKEEVIELRRWFVRAQDVRIDRAINDEILSFIKEHNVQRVAMAGRIIGCPHEEGIDYPEGTTCPHCAYWAKIDRWTGEVLK